MPRLSGGAAIGAEAQFRWVHIRYVVSLFAYNLLLGIFLVLLLDIIVYLLNILFYFFFLFLVTSHLYQNALLP